MKFEFECLDDNRWYVIFPEYPGDFEDLEMVENADKMLDALTTDGLYAAIEVEEEKPDDDGFFTLRMEGHDGDGAFYNVIGCEQFSGTIWLCNVVHELFDDHPEVLYCKVID